MEKSEGLLKAYYPSGKLKSEENYKNDLREGLQKEYYENGVLKKKDFIRMIN